MIKEYELAKKSKMHEGCNVRNTHFFKQKFFSSLYKQNAKEIIEQIDN